MRLWNRSRDLLHLCVVTVRDLRESSFWELAVSYFWLELIGGGIEESFGKGKSLSVTEVECEANDKEPTFA